MTSGFLTVNVSSAEGTLPIEGATVKIFTREYKSSGDYALADAVSGVSDDSYEYIRMTDSSGKTASVMLDAPDIELSFVEGGRVAPYSVCDVSVDKEGYLSAVFFGVQIFPSRESILPVYLRPYYESISENSRVTPNITGDNTEVFVIPSPRVFTETDRSKIEYAMPQVLVPDVSEEVYIPETISVHLGSPQSNAENVYVSFPDYIKNVSSSEIFPTWPDSAIRANVYAHISIALNRVYTEWYESQGYNFQITNSTAYDQSFVPGRNIYSNISEIVDQIFNTFVRRRGFAEPLFTTYCDGVKATCRGMTQWGSFELANEGYTPIRILRYYYGENVDLVTTDNVDGTESSYGGVPLSIGSVGDDVRTIQLQLQRIRRDYPAIPPISSANGVFGSDTDAAVRRFQSIFDLAVDGVVGKATWYRISYLYVAITKLAELGSEGSRRVPQTPPNEVLRLGDSGDNVRLLQFLLQYISIFYDLVEPVTIDGVFGQITENSVKSFQRAFGIAETGVVDEETWYTLSGVYEAIVALVTPKSPEQVFVRNLSVGSRGDEVLLIQQYLNRIADFYGNTPNVDEDGIFGPGTRTAVESFQREYLLDVTGTVDSVTWYRIVELYNLAQSSDT